PAPVAAAASAAVAVAVAAAAASAAVAVAAAAAGVATATTGRPTSDDCRTGHGDSRAASLVGLSLSAPRYRPALHSCLRTRRRTTPAAPFVRAPRPRRRPRRALAA